jgi:dienelactone hydrolase
MAIEPMAGRMTRRAVALLASVLLAACTAPRPETAPTRAPSPATSTPTPTEARPWLEPDAAFAAVSGTYRTSAGQTWVLDLQGLLVDLHSGFARALAPSSVAYHFTVGPNMGADQPVNGEVAFNVDSQGAATELSAHGSGIGDFTAKRVPYASREVHFTSGAVTLAGTLSEPAGGRHLPGIVLIHGSGVQPRPLFSLWANVYNSMGFAVLNYDKRGTGESGGTYPGELATSASLSIYAADAVAGARFLQRQPEIDRSRVGLHGGSQGGWIAPIALQRAPSLAFAVLASAPAVTTDQVDVYQGFSGDSRFVPNESDAQIDAQVRATRGGYNPAPALRSLDVPTMWVYGEKDRQVPVRLSIENLHKLRGKDLTIAVLPGGWHGLTETPNGLEPEATASTRFAPGLFTRIGEWLRERHLTRTPP